MTKYGAIKTTVDGLTFPSKREANRYALLRILEKGGKIQNLEVQPTYDIAINGTHVCKVKLDFRYFDIDRNRIVIEDSKGMDNPLSRLKRKLVEAAHGIIVELV